MYFYVLLIAPLDIYIYIYRYMDTCIYIYIWIYLILTASYQLLVPLISVPRSGCGQLVVLNVHGCSAFCTIKWRQIPHSYVSSSISCPRKKEGLERTLGQLIFLHPSSSSKGFTRMKWGCLTLKRAKIGWF